MGAVRTPEEPCSPVFDVSGKEIPDGSEAPIAAACRVGVSGPVQFGAIPAAFTTLAMVAISAFT
jgi:hypothetical protein